MPSRDEESTHAALQCFAAGMTADFTALAAGEPDGQLINPIANFLQAIVKALVSADSGAKRESQLTGCLGRPDYAVTRVNADVCSERIAPAFGTSVRQPRVAAELAAAAREGRRWRA